MNNFDTIASLFKTLSVECEKTSQDFDAMQSRIDRLECELNNEYERRAKINNLLSELMEVMK
jgi:hypothetical protein